MEKYGVEDVSAQQRAELRTVRRRIEVLRGFTHSLSLTKEACAELCQLEQRAHELEVALAASGGAEGTRA
jgi:hypothetical protein